MILSDREFVEVYWDGVEFRRGNKYDPRIISGRIYAKHPVKGAEWILSGNTNANKFERDKCLPEAEAWSAARKYTEEILEGITLVNQELQFLEISLTEIKQGSWDHGYIVVVERIIAREQAALEELKKGMR
jgi:hypothetical protein